MGKMMNHGSSMFSCQCCWEIHKWSGREYDKREVQQEIREELWEPVDWMRWLTK